MDKFIKYSIEMDARRYCIRNELTEVEDYKRIFAYYKYKYFLRHIEPFIKLKIKLLNFSLPTITVINGKVNYKYSEDTMTQIANIDRAISDIEKTYIDH